MERRDIGNRAGHSGDGGDTAGMEMMAHSGNGDGDTFGMKGGTSGMRTHTHTGRWSRGSDGGNTGDGRDRREATQRRGMEGLPRGWRNTPGMERGTPAMEEGTHRVMGTQTHRVE